MPLLVSSYACMVALTVVLSQYCTDTLSVMLIYTILIYCYNIGYTTQYWKHDNSARSAYYYYYSLLLGDRRYSDR